MRRIQKEALDYEETRRGHMDQYAGIVSDAYIAGALAEREKMLREVYNFLGEQKSFFQLPEIILEFETHFGLSPADASDGEDTDGT